MLRTVGDQPTLWESLLPPEALVMPAELERVDALLDDERFFAPYRGVLPLVVGAVDSRLRNLTIEEYHAEKHAYLASQRP